MQLLEQSNIFGLIVDARCGGVEDTRRLDKETHRFLEGSIENFHLPPDSDKENIIRTILEKARETIHTYNPKAGTYAEWILDMMSNYITFLIIKQDKEKEQAYITWKWELAYSGGPGQAKTTGVELNPFNSAYVKELRQSFLQIVRSSCNSEERRSLLLSFQNPPDIDYWAGVFEMEKTAFNSSVISAVRKLKKSIFDDSQDNTMATIIKLVGEKLSARIYITKEEMKLLEDPEKEQAIALALEKRSADEAAGHLQMKKSSYLLLLFSSLIELYGKLKNVVPDETFEKNASVYGKDFKLGESILAYRKKLLRYKQKRKPEINVALNSPEFREYKILLDFLYLLFAAQSRPPAISELLTFTMNKKASDLHISAGMPPIIRIDGDMYRINLPPFDRQTVLGLIEDVMNEKQKKIYKEDLEIDFSYKIPDGSRFRVNAFNQYRGPAAAFRSIPAKLMKLEEIGCASKLKDIVNTPSGLVLVTGPTGSGKSTTLSALIDYKNNREYKNILTIEDPVEYFHKSKKCLINQREVFRNTHGFNKALYSALREDPDIILIGELRNLETIKLALTAAETGHLVFGTLHTSSAPQTIDRIIDVFSAEEKTVVRYMLSQSLRAVISQTLVKRKGGGRVAAMEIMVTTSPIRNLIRQEKISQIYSTIQLARDEGMQTLEQHLQVLIEHGIISSEEAYSKALNRQALEISIADSKGKQ